MISKEVQPILDAIDACIAAVRAANEARQARIDACGIDLEGPPLFRKELTKGETLYDHLGRPWIVGVGKKMIPQFSCQAVSFVRAGIEEGREYPFHDPEKTEWGWTSNSVARWYRPKPKGDRLVLERIVP